MCRKNILIVLGEEHLPDLNLVSAEDNYNDFSKNELLTDYEYC